MSPTTSFSLYFFVKARRDERTDSGDLRENAVFVELPQGRDREVKDGAGRGGAGESLERRQMVLVSVLLLGFAFVCCLWRWFWR